MTKPGASPVRRTPRPDRVFEDFKAASIVDSVGRVPTGSGAPSEATSATSGEVKAKAKVKSTASDKGKAKLTRTVPVKYRGTLFTRAVWVLP